jgi:sec-independent protein translocase protein TatA
MIPNIGPLEIVVVLIIALVVFGPKRLPELGSSLGRGIREFGTGLKTGEGNDHPGEDSAKAELQSAEAVLPSARPAAAVQGESVNPKSAL